MFSDFPKSKAIAPSETLYANDTFILNGLSHILSCKAKNLLIDWKTIIVTDHVKLMAMYQQFENYITAFLACQNMKKTFMLWTSLNVGWKKIKFLMKCVFCARPAICLHLLICMSCRCIQCSLNAFDLHIVADPLLNKETMPYSLFGTFGFISDVFIFKELQ